MAALKSAFEALGCRDVRTVLASGNVVFEAPSGARALSRAISRALEKALGFPVTVLTRTERELKAIVRSEPFKAVPPGPNDQLYVTFLSEKGDTRSRVRLPEPPKGVRIVKAGPAQVFSAVLLSQGGRTPDLMRYLDRNLGPAGTTRNWRTVLKIVGTKA
jgi:uncharacterized protein (DUF1697 family)